MYKVCLSHDNIVDINSSRSQVSLIDNDNLMTFICDPTTTEPTPDQIPIYNRTNVTSKDVEYSSIKTNTILQTTDSLQSTTMRPTEDTKTNAQIPGNRISRNTVNRDDIIP